MASKLIRSNVTIPATSFLHLFGGMTSCAVHYDVIYQFSISEDLRVDSPGSGLSQMNAKLAVAYTSNLPIKISVFFP